MTKEEKTSAISSMTGFARTTGGIEAMSWAWEARSVNGKSLDVRVRLPAELSALDGPVRKKTSATFTRGNIQISLTYQAGGAEKSYRINTVLLKQLQDSGAKDVSALMSVPGVVEEISAADIFSDAAQFERLQAALLESYDILLERLASARDAEGAAMTPLLSGAVETIESYLAKAQKIADSLPESLQKRVGEKLSILAGEGLTPERIAQEAAVFVMKADVREELDRLVAHCAQARQLLGQGSPIGRKLDFLAQEFNREINTLCAKSPDIDLTQIGLELKSVIEQFREQAANVE